MSCGIAFTLFAGTDRMLVVASLRNRPVPQ
jgi:hypothetical protein